MSIKRRILAILLVVVMLLSVSGCSLLFGIIRGIDGQMPNGVTDNRDKIVAFSELEYERPDIDEISDLADDVRKLVDKGKVNDKLIGAYEEFYDAYAHYITMSNLALIRSNLDTSDEYYADEDAWCSSQSGEVERILDDLLRYCAKSDIADELDEEYFDGYLAENYGDDSIGEYTDEIVELYEQESELQTRYYELSTEMSEVSIRDTDKWDEFNAEAAEIYIDLIKVHRQLADEFGYESYYEMAYEDFGRDYSAEDTEDYVNAIKKYMVPLYKAAIEDGSLYDRYDIGTMRPQRSFRTVKNCVSDMNDTLAEIMEFMSEYEMYDVSSSSDKFEGSYTTYLYDVDSPYMLVSPSCDKSDILTIVHEFGHFCDMYSNYNEGYSLDTAEMMSQGLEYLLLCYLDDEDLAEELREYKLLDDLSLYAMQGCYSEFEHRAYALPDEELTVENINALFLEVAEEYGLTDMYYPEYLNYIWIQIFHLFEYPFYVISYCISDSAAFNIYMEELSDSGSGLDIYMDIVTDSASDDFLAIIKQHDLPSPLSAKTIKNIAKTIEDELGIA